MLRRAYHRGSILLLALLLAACSLDGQPPTSTQPARQAISATATPREPTEPATATPTVAADAIVVVPEGDGYRIEPGAGIFGPVLWLSSSRLLADWSGGGASAAFVVDPSTATTRILPSTAEPSEFIAGPGEKMALLSRPGEPPMWPIVRVLDMEKGAIETAFSVDASTPQWAGPRARAGFSTQKETSVAVTWVGPSHFVATFSVYAGRDLRPRQKLLLVDTDNRRVDVLAEEGMLAAALPDGTLLFRSGWVDGDLRVLAPPYTGQPVMLSPGGPWTTGWAPSADGRRVAWLEASAPPGDWSQRLPYGCCSSDPQPDVHTLVIWDRASDSLERRPIEGVRWLHGHGLLHWRANGETLIYAALADDDSSDTIVREIGISGPPLDLARHEIFARLGSVVEGAGGSLYYALGEASGSNYAQVTRRYPDGRLENLREGTPHDWYMDERGYLVGPANGGTLIQDLVAGTSYHVNHPHTVWVKISPDGRWVLQSVTPSSGGRDFHRIVRLR